MFKKIFGFLVIFSILANFLSACGGNATTDKKAQELLAGLNTKARLLTNQPGWVHVNEKVVYDTDSQNRGTLLNGTIIPLVQTIDIWYHINAEKRVYEYVWIMSDQNGETIDVGVFVNNNLYDLMNNTSTPLNPYYLSLDYQFADEMDSFFSRNGHPVVTTEEVNGKTATLFTLDETLAAPKTTTDYTQPLVAAGSIAYFDTETGFLLKIIRTATLADGTKRTFYTDNLAIETGVQPTDEVLNYVNGIW